MGDFKILVLKNNFILLFILSPLSQCANIGYQIVFGSVGGGNYTYYWISQPGTVELTLYTIEGDADLYVSSKDLKPTFDIENHELQSTTCGIEEIIIPAGYNPPLSIAVYGHPSHDISDYKLEIFVYDNSSEVEEVSLEISSLEHKKPISSSASRTSIPMKDRESELEERSFLWTVFIHLFQILLDILIE